MDVFRIFLSLGLVVLLWRLDVRGIRPIRNFILWGVDYPFHFLLTATLILVIWGVVGSGFGLQGLFLDEDPLTQVLLGATVMLLFAAITVHYVALGTSRRGWWAALHRLTMFLRRAATIASAGRPAQAALPNGFLEKLSTADIEAIDLVAWRRLTAPSETTAEARDPLQACLEDVPFRVLIAPAVLLEKGFGLILLVGVVPAILIPLLRREPAACLERLPWLVGVCLGNVLAIILGCKTTAWLAEAADWRDTTRTILASIRRRATELPLAEPAGDDRELGSVTPAARPAWLTFLLWFFLVHAAVTLLPPETVTSRWIDWPERTLAPEAGWHGFVERTRTFPWLPLAVLAGEAVVAAVVSALVALVPRWLGRERLARLTRQWKALASSGVTLVVHGLALSGLRTFSVVAAVTLALASVLATILMSPEATISVWLGLRGYASLGGMLVCWLAIFWLTTHAAGGSGIRTAAEQRAATIALSGLVLLHVLGAPAKAIGPLAALAAIVSGSRTLAALRPSPLSARLRVAIAGGLALAAAASLTVAWRNGHSTLAAGVWLGLATLFLGSTALSSLARRQPAMIYPLTVMLGYLAFALAYAGLDERWQSAMPAAGSIACIVALLAAAYTILTFVRPRSALLSIAAILGTAVLLNGAALFVAPNEFKASFPGMSSYYALPVYLDSRDYFRETTPSTARLRNRAVTDDFDRLAKQGPSERLATVFFTMRPLASRADGGHAVVLEVDDRLGRLRAAAGDRIRLAAEEWFTIRIEGDDCIALAEEPFYRKIFPWFRYETLHTIRDGIIRGPTQPLVKEGTPLGPRRTGVPEPTRYRTITRDEPDPRLPADVMGLRLLGLADRYRAADAEYALISLNWTGLVTTVRHEPHRDLFTVEFELPPGAEPLDDQQLRTMSSWMERCHLDTLRPAVAASQVEDNNAARLDLSRGLTGEGDCVVLEDARAESPVPVEVFLASGETTTDDAPAFASHRLTADVIARTIAATPAPSPSGAAPAPADEAPRFTLRVAHDRGLFASPDAAIVRRTAGQQPGSSAAIDLALYNTARLRIGDRLILTWNGHGSGTPSAMGHGGVFELSDLGGEPPANLFPGCPAGAVQATLRPVEGLSATLPASASAGHTVVGRWELIRLLNNAEVLLAWKKLVGDRWKGGKPKLVIVTLSGGGIRASVWTSVVLRKLEATLGADFPYHIRIITGASGGMVAGSYYATSLRPPPTEVLRGGAASFADLHGTSIDEFVDRMATDQLDAVAGRMIFGDVPAALAPFARRDDRGRTLEQTWIRWTGGPTSPLGRPLQSYAADERMGWRPSLVYTPMMVEDGRRLLISNLDLAFATRNVGGLLLEPSSRKIERPTIQGGDFDLSIHEEDDVFSLSAVEFFRLFPDAHDFRVTTATRMSASFPWVSPAINLPTLPPRRIVDAGYYDNYGVNLTALWLSKMSGWLRENTSGVLVVQVRDKVSQGARTEIDFDRLGDDDSALDRLVWHGGSKVFRPGLQAVTTPLIGLTNARQWTMAFRNDEQVDLQDLLFDDERGRDFFRTVVFECPVDVSLNWQLTEREKAILTGGFGRPDAAPREELSRVLDFMTGKDSYEFHKWRIDHRNDPSFQRQLKARYDEQLRSLGVRGTERLTAQESQNLYENVIKTLKRLELLADWWNTGRVNVP
jgi:hypothetical protein